MVVTIRDVAVRAGVSVGTVSNVLNARATVAPESARRVQQAIDELGYVRNDVARRLRMGHGSTIGLVVLNVGNPFFADLARGAEDEAERYGMSVILGNSDENVDREAAYLDLFQQQRVRGILLSPYGEAGSRLQRIRDAGTPVVLVDRRSGDDHFSSVSVDDVAGGRLAAEHLLAGGRRRLAFAGGPADMRQISERLRGAQAAVAEASGATLEVIATAASSVHEGRSVGNLIAERLEQDRPDAIFAANDLLAFGILQALLFGSGIRVPEDIAIVGYDDIDFASAAFVPLSSVRQPSQLIGRTALGILREEIENASQGTQTVVFTPELVVRASSAR